MRIQIASDLHLERLSSKFPKARIITRAPDADMLVLAGDIAEGAAGIKLFADWPVPVLYVMGNHEAYLGIYQNVLDELKRQAAGTSVIVLDNDVADLSGFGKWSDAHQDELARLRFLGCTLWTNYRLGSKGTSLKQRMDLVAYVINDHKYIQISEDEVFTPIHALAEHNRSRRWLEVELERPFAGKTIVVTHHAPHGQSINFKDMGNPVNAAFASHLPELTAQADLWIHGHLHDSVDFIDGRCRVVANPMGGAMNRDEATDESELQAANYVFRDRLVVEV